MPLRTETRTRSSLMSGRAPLMVCTRITMRSLRSRSSLVSTKPDKVTLKAGAVRIGCAMRAVFQVASVKPNAIAAAATATGNASGRARAATQSEIAIAVSVDAGPQKRLAIRREIEDNAEAECDRQPRNQPARRGVIGDPVAQTRARRAAGEGTARRASLATRRGRVLPSGHVPARAPVRAPAARGLSDRPRPP